MKSIKIKVTSFIVVILILGLGGVSLLNYFETWRLLTANLEQSVSSLTLSSGSEVGLWLNARKAEMELMASMPLIQSGDRDAVIAYTNAETQRNKIYEQFFVADNQGNYYLNSGKTGSVVDRDYFQKVMSTGNTVISDPLISRGSGNQIVVVAAPIKKSGKVVGLIGGNVNLAELSQKVSAAKVGKIGYAFMVQEDGLIIAHPDQNLVMKYNPLDDNDAHPKLKEAVKRMTEGEIGATRYSFNDEEKYMAFAPIPGIKWALGVTVPATYMTNQLRHLPVYFIAVMLFFGFFLVLLLSRWLVGPLSRLAKTTTDLTNRVHDEQVEVNWMKTPVIEVDSLISNFRHMATVLHEKFKELKNANESLEVEIAGRKSVEENLQKSYEELGVTYEELGATEEELRCNYLELQKREEALRESEELFRMISESSPIGVYILQDGRFQIVNKQFQECIGYEENELLNMKSMQLVFQDDKGKVRDCAIKMLKGKDFLPYEYRAVKKSGEIMWVMETIAPIKYEGKKATLGNFMDITERKIMDKALQESEIKFRALFEEALNPVFIFNENGRYIDTNKAGLDFFKCRKEELMNKFISESHHSDIEQNSYLGPGTLEVKYLVSGSLKTMLLNIVALNLSGNKFFYGIGQDITGRKIMEEKLKHMSLHDPLTGLYNRTYFEEEMRRLEGNRHAPVGIVVCDVDGLKLVNDTLGHSKGDELLRLTADLIKKCFRTEDAISRIGGDEFSVIVPKSNLSIVGQACRRVQDTVARYNTENPEFPLSLSVGFAVGGETYANMSNIFKEADNNMYREKLHRSQSTRSAIVQALMKALEARDFITEGHAERLQSLVETVGETLDMSDSRLVDLRLLAQFHDIGKVGVPDRILFKPGSLTQEEFAEMQRHSEIGHRIAQSAPDLVPIANWILKHHEWWNGNGYPLGIKEEDIPLECRILAIADAYDAMTSDRPYRKAMRHEEALQELKRYAGTQFDPKLVLIFVNIFKNQSIIQKPSDTW